MVLRSMPASRNLKLSVPKTSSKGNPAEKPSASMRQLAGCKYKRQASRQVRTVLVGVSDEVAVSDMGALSAVCWPLDGP